MRGDEMLYIVIFIIAAIVGILILMGYNMPASKNQSTHFKMGTLIAIGSFILLIVLILALNQLISSPVNVSIINEMLQKSLM